MEGEPRWGKPNCVGAHSWPSNPASGKIAQKTGGQVAISLAEERRSKALQQGEHGAAIYPYKHGAGIFAAANG